MADFFPVGFFFGFADLAYVNARNPTATTTSTNTTTNTPRSNPCEASIYNSENIRDPESPFTFHQLEIRIPNTKIRNKSEVRIFELGFICFEFRYSSFGFMLL